MVPRRHAGWSMTESADVDIHGLSMAGVNTHHALGGLSFRF
jgi:hypothetical protein